jgi:hypothetical protein
MSRVSILPSWLQSYRCREFSTKPSYLACEYCIDHKSPYMAINLHAAVRYAGTFFQMLSLVHESNFDSRLGVFNPIRSFIVRLPKPQDLSDRGGIEQVTIIFMLLLINTIVL